MNPFPPPPADAGAAAIAPCFANRMARALRAALRGEPAGRRLSCISHKPAEFSRDVAYNCNINRITEIPSVGDTGLHSNLHKQNVYECTNYKMHALVLSMGCRCWRPLHLYGASYV